MGIRDYLSPSTTDTLSDAEQAELERCEDAIRVGLAAALGAGQALRTIRDKQLFRMTHETFERYCREKWHLSKSRAYQLIDFAQVAENVDSGGRLTEPAARRLARLKPEEQREAWTELTADDDDTTEPIATERVEAATQKRRPKKKRKAPKPTRIRVPGGTVIVERRNYDRTIDELLADAIQKTADTKPAARHAA